MAIKSFKVGTVQTKKSGVGATVKLGNFSKNAKYATSTEVTIRDSGGNVLANRADCYLVVKNPREREGITEEELAKIPAWVKHELYLIVDDTQ